MKKQDLYNQVIAYFEKEMPVAETELHYENPFQILIAVILSAQCTDKRVNMITPPLFHDYPTPKLWQAVHRKLFSNTSIVSVILIAKPNIW